MLNLINIESLLQLDALDESGLGPVKGYPPEPQEDKKGKSARPKTPLPLAGEDGMPVLPTSKR